MAIDESFLFIVYLCTPSSGDSFSRGSMNNTDSVH